MLGLQTLLQMNNLPVFVDNYQYLPLFAHSECYIANKERGRDEDEETTLVPPFKAETYRG